MVPNLWLNLAGFHGMFAPNSGYRARVTPGKRGRDRQRATTVQRDESVPGKRCTASFRAPFLMRVFGIDIAPASM